jgi:signal transduction histidine kinase
MKTAQGETAGLVAPANASYRWRYAAAFAAVFMLLAFVAGFVLYQQRNEAAARERLNWALDVQRAALEMENASTLMEVYQRGFLLTGSPTAVEQRDAVYRRGLQQSDILSRLLADTPALRPDAQALVAAFRRRHAVMRQVTAAAERDGLASARAAFSLRGDRSVGPVLASIEAVRREQRRLGADATRRAEIAARQSNLVALYGTLLGLGTLAVAAWLLLRQVARNEDLHHRLLLAHEEEKARSAELARSNRELEAFSYTISHDLRAPLRHIGGYARMLQEDAGDQLDAEMRRYLDTIGDSSRRMGMLIDDLLAYSRLGRKSLERVEVDMEDLTRRMVEELPDARDKIVVSGLPPVHADPVLLRQAWFNLLSNALKYSAPRGDAARVEIEGTRANGRARYVIRDNGVGFDMRYADKLFGVFQRLHSQDEFEGTGVGLAIVQQIVERHGGRVWAEAAPGAGATFYMELPAGEIP